MHILGCGQTEKDTLHTAEEGFSFFFLFLTTVVKRSYSPHQPHRYACRPSGPTRFHKSPASGPEELSDTVSGSVDAPAGF